MAKFITLVNGIPVMQDVTVASPYDESISYSSGLTSGTAITLPNSGSFTDSSAKDIIITLNGVLVEVTRDFTVVGAGPTYTQISFNYNLSNGSIVRFKKNI